MTANHFVRYWHMNVRILSVKIILCCYMLHCYGRCCFFTRLSWFAVNRLAFSLEETADNAVLGKTDITADDYAEILFGVAATRLIPFTTISFSRNHTISDRISAILKTPGTSKGGSIMKNIKKYVLLLSALAVLVLCLFVNFTCSNRHVVKSDSPDGIYMTVFGKVVDPEGNPVAGIPVDVAREKPRSNNFGNSLTGDTRFTVKTDSAGNFSISFPSNVRASTFHNLVNEGKNKNGGIVLVAHAGNTTTYIPEHEWLPGLANGISKPVKVAGRHCGAGKYYIDKRCYCQRNPV